MLKVNDVVVGNAMANKYAITCAGWVGVVTSIDEGDSNLIWVKPFNGPGDDRYNVSMECFDLYKPKHIMDALIELNTKPAKVTKVSKQELLDVLSAQNDCYYSLAQVVDMIKNLEDPKPEPLTPGNILLEEIYYDRFLDQVRERLEGNFSGQGGDRFIDLDTADFSLNSSNTVELDSVDLNADEVVDTAMECLENVMCSWVVRIEKK